MPHSAPNIPPSEPGRVHLSTINSVLKSAKGNSNTQYGNGIEGSYGSYGNSAQMGNVSERESFWAMLTRRLRYFSRPSLSYLRIPMAEKIQKFSQPTTEYDIAGWYKPNALWIKDGSSSPEPSAIQLFRNPWDSYDGYVKGDGTWEEKNPYQFWPLNGQTNEYYYGPKEERYVQTGAKKGTSGLLNAYAYPGSPSRLPEAEYYLGYCPQYIWCYSWCELMDELDLKRAHAPIFPVTSFKPPRQWEIKWMSRHPAPIVQDPNQPPYDPDNNPEVILRRAYVCSEWAIAEEFKSQGGAFGNAMAPNRAHEVNNARTLCGTIVRMFRGKGNYYLFNNPQAPSDPPKGTQQVENAPYHFWAQTYSISDIW